MGCSIAANMELSFSDSALTVRVLCRKAGAKGIRPRTRHSIARHVAAKLERDGKQKQRGTMGV